MGSKQSTSSTIGVCIDSDVTCSQEDAPVKIQQGHPVAMIVGDSRTGKSLLFSQLASKSIRQGAPKNEQATLTNKQVTPKDEQVYKATTTTEYCRIFDGHYNLMLIDTPGCVSLRKQTMESFYLGNIFLVVFNTSDRSSFEHVRYWLDTIDNCARQEIKAIYVIAMTKHDKLSARVISEEEIEAHVKFLNFRNRKVSRITLNTGDKYNRECFESLGARLLNLIKESKQL
jgi:GTPase SAR1 family protein